MKQVLQNRLQQLVPPEHAARDISINTASKSANAFFISIPPNCFCSP